jgi:hypothetical protein
MSQTITSFYALNRVLSIFKNINNVNAATQIDITINRTRYLIGCHDHDDLTQIFIATIEEDGDVHMCDDYEELIEYFRQNEYFLRQEQIRLEREREELESFPLKGGKRKSHKRKSHKRKSHKRKN